MYLEMCACNHQGSGVREGVCQAGVADVVNVAAGARQMQALPSGRHSRVAKKSFGVLPPNSLLEVLGACRRSGKVLNSPTSAWVCSTWVGAPCFAQAGSNNIQVDEIMVPDDDQILPLYLVVF